MATGASKLYRNLVHVIIVGLCVVAALEPKFEGGAGYCVMLGTMFGQTVAASLWMAAGPARIPSRLAFSLVWVALLLAACWINLSFFRSPEPNAVTFSLFICLAAQWLLMQGLLWGLVFTCGLRLQNRHEKRERFDPRDQQFGTRELFVFTTIVGIALAVGRVAVERFALKDEVNAILPLYVFLAVATALMALTLLLAALLSRSWVSAAVVVGGLIVLATMAELPLLRLFELRGEQLNMTHLICINSAASVWAVAFAIAIRLAGYHLGRPESGSETSRTD